jgi:hypothetical protein
MRLFSLLPATILAATAALLGASAQAGPMPTNVASMSAMVDKATTEVRYGRGARLAYRGGVGYGRLGYGGVAAGVAGAIVAGAVARSVYYGDGYGAYGGGYPAYDYAPHHSGYGDAPGYGYGGGGGYVVRQYGW